MCNFNILHYIYLHNLFIFFSYLKTHTVLL
nr:MAG TPA: hypothetical protein [Caudoviricetes sp.]